MLCQQRCDWEDAISHQNLIAQKVLTLRSAISKLADALLPLNEIMTYYPTEEQAPLLEKAGVRFGGSNRMWQVWCILQDAEVDLSYLEEGYGMLVEKTNRLRYEYEVYAANW